MYEQIKIARLMPRTGGALIDLMIILIITLIVLLIWGFVVGLNGSERNLSKEYSEHLWEARGALVGLITDFIYTVAMQSSSTRATLGQKAVGVCIVKTNMLNASIGTLVLRYFISIFSSLLLKVGFLIALFTKNKQTLHDLIAGTMVIEHDFAESSAYTVQNKLNLTTEEHAKESSGAIIPIISAMMIVGTIVVLIRHYSK